MHLSVILYRQLLVFFFKMILLVTDKIAYVPQIGLCFQSGHMYLHYIHLGHLCMCIHSGPLLYHFTDMANQSSVELSYEEVRKIIVKFNFDIVVSMVCSIFI